VFSGLTNFLYQPPHSGKGNSMTARTKEIIDLVILRTPETTSGGHLQLRRILEAKSAAELDQMYEQMLLDAKEEELIRIQAEIAAERALFQLSREPQYKAEAAQQEKKDREIFKQAARQFKFSTVEANYRVLVSNLGPGLTLYSIRNAIASNAVSLAAPFQHELAQWAREAEQERQKIAEERTDYLTNHASPTELRQVARAEAEQSRIQAQQQHIQQQIRVREQAEASLGLPVLPKTSNDGQKIDRIFLLRLADTDIKKYKQWCSFYGFSAITARLNGVQ
jgi:hypothetical protein